MRLRPLLIALLLLLPAAAARADLGYHVQMVTTALGGHPAGPFSLDFQLIDGDGVVNNTVQLSNFAFGSGSATGDPLTLIGGASGDLTTGVTLSDTDFLNEFEQGFTPGDSLSFDLLITTNFAGGIPDGLSFAILDSTPAELPTLSPLSVFFQIDVTGSEPLIQTFASDPNQSPVAGGEPLDIPAPILTPFTTGVTAPEPATLSLILVAAFSTVRRLRRALEE